MIVEDERDMADLVARRLAREGYAVDVAPDGLTGLDKIRSWPTDLALVDIMLPHLSGTDLVTVAGTDLLRIAGGMASRGVHAARRRERPGARRDGAGRHVRLRPPTP